MSFLTPEILCGIMFIVICGMLMFGYPVAFTLAGTSLIFAFIANLLGMFDLSFLSAFPQRIFAVMRNEVLVAVPLFVFMGVVLERSKIAEELLEEMGRLFGNLRGGLGYSVCIVGALLAASTGIVGATVVTMGLISLPTMLKRGYSPSLACGTICASGTLGQVIPPSIVLVLLGDQLSTAYQKAQFDMGNFSPDTVSVNDLFAGSLIPGLVLVGLYILYQVIVAIVNPDASPAIPQDELSSSGDTSIARVLATLLAPILLIVAVLGSILGGFASPTEASSVGAIGALMLAGYRIDHQKGKPIIIATGCLLAMLMLTSFFDLRMQRETVSTTEWVAIAIALFASAGLIFGIAVAIIRVYRHRTEDSTESTLTNVMNSTLSVSAMVFTILIGASMFSLVFRGLGGDEIIEGFLTNIPGGTVSVLLVVMAIMFLLGFILDYLEIVFIVVPIVAPILLTMEVAPGIAMSPVWLGVMMSVNLQTSFLTPPFGFSLFYLRGVAPPSITTLQIYKGVIPFVFIQVLMLIVLWFMPEFATWLPELIYDK